MYSENNISVVINLSDEFDFGDDDNDEVIGRGTWIDKLALEVIERKDKLKGKHPPIIRCESGLGASGFPHIGSFADASRAYGFKLAIEDLGRESEYIAFADDMDGLRKVPAGTPPELDQYLGQPVSTIPDPWGCHESYGRHMASLLIDSLETAAIEFTPKSAYQLYTSGAMAPMVEKVLKNAQKAGELIEETTGQEKYLTVLPYHAICEKCNKIYTTKAINFDPDNHRVEYICEGEEIRGKQLEGCQHRGWSDYTKGEGKLTWKVEFAARWTLLQIDFEAFGKDIYESVMANDLICEKIFNYEPPVHARYEMFLDKSGSKISKSKGNVFTPQTWFRYGSSQSLALLTYKRMVGARTLAIDDIPVYMEEMDYLEDVYFGRIKVKNPNQKRKLTGLYEYCWHLDPPKQRSLHIPYNVLVNLIAVAPEKSREEFLEKQLREYGYLRSGHSLEDIQDRITYATNWVHDFETIEEVEVDLDPEEKEAVRAFIATIEGADSADEVQSAVFETARARNMKPGKFFRLLYRILLNTNSGPKLGPYIKTIGIPHTIKVLKKNLKE
ncbi:MAG: lysine--tRNA ligase [Candidatus Heimdallarchaeota archaeon]|nr:lysine--tRNA ligase [Candidatus Heimdallarchaeota archaeon]